MEAMCMYNDSLTDFRTNLIDVTLVNEDTYLTLLTCHYSDVKIFKGVKIVKEVNRNDGL